MDDLATECGALFEATVFLSHFNDMPDPRVTGAKVWASMCLVLRTPTIK